MTPGEQDWHEAELVDAARYTDCVESAASQAPEARARCDRDDYLEARCRGINAYREALREGSE